MMPDDASAGMAGPTPRRWRPAPVFWFSAVVHGAAAAAALVRPEWWPWAAAAVVGNHALLAGAGLWPRSSLLGPNLVRLPAAAARRREICITFDDGPDPEVTPRVLDLLDRHGAKASFFCIGERALAHPAVVEDVMRRGHGVENHSQRHSTAFGWYGLGRLQREIEAAQRALSGITGSPPRFFRAPFGMRNPLLEPALARCGLRLASWTRRGYDTVRRDPARVLAHLSDQLGAGDVLLLHDGTYARGADGMPVVLTVLPALLKRVGEAGLNPVSLTAACGDASDV